MSSPKQTTVLHQTLEIQTTTTHSPTKIPETPSTEQTTATILVLIKVSVKYVAFKVILQNDVHPTRLFQITPTHHLPHKSTSNPVHGNLKQTQRFPKIISRPIGFLIAEQVIMLQLI